MYTLYSDGLHTNNSINVGYHYSMATLSILPTAKRKEFMQGEVKLNKRFKLYFIFKLYPFFKSSLLN